MKMMKTMRMMKMMKRWNDENEMMKRFARECVSFASAFSLPAAYRNVGQYYLILCAVLCCAVLWQPCWPQYCHWNVESIAETLPCPSISFSTNAAADAASLLSLYTVATVYLAGLPLRFILISILQEPTTKRRTSKPKMVSQRYKKASK